MRRLFALLLVLFAVQVSATTVSVRLEGVRTFDIGPGQPHTFQTVPWGDLQAGDVVNIHYRTEPYLYKIALRAKGTAEHPVVINGVTGPMGQRPVLNFQGAATAAGSASVFTTSPQFGESLGGILIQRGQGEAYEGPKPSHIHIKNLVLRNAKGSYTSVAGITTTYGITACIYVMNSADLLIENNEIYGCGNGIFFMAKDGLLSQTSERPVIRGNKVYGNGTPGSYLEHNLYIQSLSPIMERNYIGKLVDGAQGSSLKDRSAGAIIRYNYIVSSEGRAADLVDSQDQGINGIITRPEYGKDWMYGNVFFIDSAGTAIHFGGDTWCETEGSNVCVPLSQYRSRLKFYDNTLIYTLQGWRNVLFDLSLATTRVDAWNNTFHVGPQTENHHIVEYAGTVCLGKNVVVGPVQYNGRDGFDPSQININFGCTLP
jgi:hypothetical protein